MDRGVSRTIDPPDGGNLIKYISFIRSLPSLPGLCSLEPFTLHVIRQVVIGNFAGKDAEKIFNGEFSRQLESIKGVAFRKLAMLHTAKTPADLKVPPGNCLEALKGDRSGQHRIRINQQFRVCFTWHDGNAYDVEIVDYH